MGAANSDAHPIGTLAGMRPTRHAPLDPATTDLFGRALRHAALGVLLRVGGALSIEEIDAHIALLGRRVDSAYPGKALADALRYETLCGRVRRVGRGRYAVGRVSHGMRYRVLSRFGWPVAS